jgi:rhodanese-related sulfurtransferase
MEDLKISLAEAKALLDRRRAVFLDARSPEDWARSDQQLPGSLRVAPDYVPARASEWPSGAVVIAYCT